MSGSVFLMSSFGKPENQSFHPHSLASSNVLVWVVETNFLLLWVYASNENL